MDLYKVSLVPKYYYLMKAFISRQIYNMNRSAQIKTVEGNSNNGNDFDTEKISIQYDYNEIPLYEAKDIYYEYKYYNDKYDSIFEITKFLFNLKEKDFTLETGILLDPNSYIFNLFFFYKFIFTNNFSLL